MKQYTLILLFSFCCCVISCTHKKSAVEVYTSQQIGESQGSCSHFTKDSKGNIILSWIKKKAPGNNIFCFAVSKDSGASFGKIIEIPGSEKIHPHGENMPKMIVKPNGEMIAVWPVANPNPKNDYSDLVYYAQSFDNGETWSAVKNLVTDTASYDQRYFDLALLPNGEAAIIWLDNRKNTEKTGSALYFATTAGSNGFQNEHLIQEPTCECCRTALLVAGNKNIHVVYRAILNDSIRDIVHAVSTDNGQHFSKPLRISDDRWMIRGCPHTGPAICENEAGLHFSWFTGGDKAGVYYTNSKDNGKDFSPRRKVSGSQSRHSQIISLGKNVVNIWNENILNNKKAFSRIGLEVSDSKGELLFQQMITPQNGSATFPAIQSIDNEYALITYTETISDADFVRWLKIKL